MYCTRSIFIFCLFFLFYALKYSRSTRTIFSPNHQQNPTTYPSPPPLAVGGWAVTFGTAMRGLRGAAVVQAPTHCTKCNSPPINGQCTNHHLLYSGPLLSGFSVPTKEFYLTDIAVELFKIHVRSNTARTIVRTM